MIKINLGLRFSTIRFPEEYRKAFAMNRGIKSCLTLTELAQFINGNDKDIKKYGKTVVLEYLNQIPLSFKFRSLMDSPLKIYFYSLTLEQLNLYQQQLVLSNLIKLSLYSGIQAKMLKDLIRQREKRIEQMVKVKPFDVVDAINWLVMRKHLMSNKFALHSLEVLCNSPLSTYSNTCSKMMNMVMKKISELEWIEIRQFRNIFLFLCHQYEECSDNLAVQVSNCYRLALLNLHQLGYDCIPFSILALLNKVPQLLPSMEVRLFEQTYFFLNQLPLNVCHPSTSRLLFAHALQTCEKELVFLHMLPLSRLTPSQIQRLLCLYCEKWLDVWNSIYYINKFNMKFIGYSSLFMEKLFDRLMKIEEKGGKVRVSLFGGQIAAINKLLNYYRYDEQKVKAITRQFNHRFALLRKENNLEEILSYNSLVNIFHLLHMQKNFGVELDEKEMMPLIRKQLLVFNRKKVTSKIKSIRSTIQIKEIISHYKNNSQVEIIELINSIVNYHLNYSDDNSLRLAAWLLFSLESSHNSYRYKGITSRLYSLFQKYDCVGLADQYIMFDEKNQSLTTYIIQKLAHKAANFKPVFKILSHTDQLYLEGTSNRDLSSFIATMFSSKQELQMGDLNGLSMGEITALLKICTSFSRNMGNMACRILKLVVLKVGAQFQELSEYQTVDNQLIVCWEVLQLAEILKVEDRAVVDGIRVLWERVKAISERVYYLGGLKCEFLGCRGEGQRIQQEYSLLLNSQQLQPVCKLQTLLIFKMAVEGNLELQAGGLVFVAELIKGKLDAFAINPTDIRCHTQGRINQVVKGSLLTEILTHCITLEIQLGVQFYIYCLRVASQLQCQTLMELTFGQLRVHIHQQFVVRKMVDVMIQCREWVDPGLIRHMVNCMRMELPHKSAIYLHLMYYLTIIDGTFMAQYGRTVKQMTDSSTKRLHYKIKALNTNISISNKQDQEFLSQIFCICFVIAKNQMSDIQSKILYQYYQKHLPQIKELIVEGYIKGLPESQVATVLAEIGDWFAGEKR